MTDSTFPSGGAAVPEPRVDELIAQLSASRKILYDAVNSVRPELRGMRPGEDRWSVAEILEHLIRVETAIAGLVRAAAASEDPVPEEEFNSVGREVVLDRSTKVQSTEGSRPTGTLGWTEALAGLASSRRAMEGAVRLAGVAGLARMRAPHPLFGVLDGEGWVSFVGSHEERHAEQVREVGAALAG